MKLTLINGVFKDHEKYFGNNRITNFMYRDFITAITSVCTERSYYFDDAALVNINVENQRIIHIIT